MQYWKCVGWRMDRLWNLMILQMLFRKRSWHLESGKKSAGNVSGILSVKVRKADGRNRCLFDSVILERALVIIAIPEKLNKIFYILRGSNE